MKEIFIALTWAKIYVPYSWYLHQFSSKYLKKAHRVDPSNENMAWDSQLERQFWAFSPIGSGSEYFGQVDQLEQVMLYNTPLTKTNQLPITL